MRKASPPPEATAKKHTFRLWLAALVVVNLLARLPLVWDPVEVRNDGAEYLAIARSLRATGVYATDLKYHFYTEDPLRHSAWADRPPLYPATAVLWQRLLAGLDPTAAARLGNVLLACLALVLCALYLRRVYRDDVALLASGYVFLLPQMLYWTCQPMTEALSLALTYGTLGAKAEGERRKAEGERRKAEGWTLPALSLGVGVLTGLAYLTRPTGVLLLLAVLIAGPRMTRRPHSSFILHPSSLIAIGFLICAVPYHALLWRTYGSPFHSSLGYTFSVRDYYEVTYHGFERPMVGTLDFLREHGGEVPGLILRQAASHAPSLLLPLLALLPLALRMRREDWSGERRAAAALIVLTVALHTVVWSAWGSQRYFLGILPLLVAALLAAGLRARDQSSAISDQSSVISRWWMGVLIGVLLAGLVGALAQFYAQQLRPDHGRPGLTAVRAAAESVRGAPVIASDKPGTLNLLLETPAVMLPRTRDPGQLSRFIEKYRPDVLVLFVDEPLKREAEEMAGDWRAGRLPPGWRLAEDTGGYLIVRRSAARN